MKKMYRPLIAVLVFMLALITAEAQDTAKIAFTGMNPHIGQYLYFRVVDISNDKEVGRISVLITVPDFTLGVGGIQPGGSYNLDFFADLNKNGRYDFPGDHTWRITLNSVKGDTTVSFTHNTAFTNIDWVQRITLAFSNMNPHLGENLYFALKNKNSGWEYERRKLTETSAAFNVNFDGIMPDSSYVIDFFADHNKNGRYDPPGADHAWRITLDNVKGDTVVPFIHNTNFTDIEWIQRITVAFSNMNPHLGENLYFALKNKNSGWEYERRKLTETSAAFNVDFNGIMPDTSYVIDFFADHNKNGKYDPPGADHAWRIMLDSVKGDTVVPFIHNTSFTDIGWVQRITVAFSKMNPHLGENLYFALKNKNSGWEYERRKLTETSATFNVDFDGIMPDTSYVIDFFADHSKNGKYDPPGTDHAWRITIDSVKGDTVVPFVHNTNFTDIAWKYKLTVNFTDMTPHVDQVMKLYLRNSETMAFIDSSMLDPIQQAVFSLSLFSIVPDSSYNIDFYVDFNENGMYDIPPDDHAWRIPLLDVRGDTIVNFAHNTEFTDIGLAVISGIVDLDGNGFSTYPNPAKDELIIKSKRTDGNITGIKIFNSTGRLVIDQSRIPAGAEVRVNVSSLKPGLYILNIGEVHDSKKLKFIKE
jgi:hypothetical protein